MKPISDLEYLVLKEKINTLIENSIPTDLEKANFAYLHGITVAGLFDLRKCFYDVFEPKRR